jgi:hypothetical protein
VKRPGPEALTNKLTLPSRDFSGFSVAKRGVPDDHRKIDHSSRADVPLSCKANVGNTLRSICCPKKLMRAVENATFHCHLMTMRENRY